MPPGHLEVARNPEFTQQKCRVRYDLAMGTKQHKRFCEICNAITNHVTSYSDDAGRLVASVRCSDHSDATP